MTEEPGHHYPPPGAPLPAQPPAGTPYPAYPPQPYPPTQPYPTGGYPLHGPNAAATGMLGAAHKPGAIPLRPLNLGAIYDGAFRIIRFNPKATVGAAVLVTAISMLIPVAVTTVLTFTVGVAIDAAGEVDEQAGTAEIIGSVAAYGSLLLAMLLAQVGIIFVTGMIAHVAHAAAVGRRLSLGQAWAATHGKRWRLIGLTLLINLVFLLVVSAYIALWVVVTVASPEAWPIVVWGLVSVPAFIALCCWFWIRVYYFPVPALMLEDVGVFAAIGRGWRLSTGQFWRTFGIALLTVIVASFAGSILSTPVTFAGQFAALALPGYAALLLVLTQAVGLVIQNAFVAPFVSSVTSLQYLDQRMRKEAYDVELMRAAGIAE